MKVVFSNKSEMSLWILIIIASLLVLFLIPKSIEGGYSQGPYVMNLTIGKTIGISLSDPLATNITYTNTSCAVTNTECPITVGRYNNATWNNVTGYNGTWYNITNSGTTYEDICAVASDHMICGNAPCTDDRILLGNATWQNSTYKNWGWNIGANGTWTTSYGTANLTAGKLAYSGVGLSSVYLRFFIYVPATIVPGVYNTTYTYCAVETGQACTC